MSSTGEAEAGLPSRRHRLLALALEIHRRSLVTLRKLEELAEQVGMARPQTLVVPACSRNPAGFWMEPILALAGHSGLPRKTLMEMQAVIEERKGEIQAAWKKHFGARR